MPETREQQRAREAWTKLTERFGNDPAAWGTQQGTAAKSYLNALRQTAARIHISGLGQALVFLKSRNLNPPKDAAKDLANLVLRVTRLGNDDGTDTLVNVLRERGLPELMQATEEALAMIAWLCRYLQGAGVVPEEDSS